MSWQNEKSNHENILFSCGSILLYVERVVIPASLKKKILKDFYTGHLGITYEELRFLAGNG